MQLVYFSLMISTIIGPMVFRTRGSSLHPSEVSTLVPAFGSIEESLFAVLGLICCLAMLGRYGCWRGQRRVLQGGNIRSSWDRFKAWKSGLLWIWVITSPTYLYFSGWLSVPQREDWMLSSYFVLISWWALPAVTLAVLLDISEYRLLRTIQSYVEQVTSEKLSDTSASIMSTRSIGRGRKPSSVQHEWIVVALPCIIACCFIDAFAFAESGLRQLPMNALATVTWTPIIVRGAIVAFAFLAVAAIYPFLVVKYWSVQHESLPQIVLDNWLKAGGTESQVRVWKTGYRINGAMVVGWAFPFRYLLVSDRLLAEASSETLRMIVLHEIGHIQRYHAWLRILPVFLGGIILTFLVTTGQGWIMAGLVVAVLIGQSWLLSKIAYWTEFDADRSAAEAFFDQILSNPSDTRFQSPQELRYFASMAMADALKKIVPSRYHGRSTWLHPSVKAREASLLTSCSNKQSSVVESSGSVILLPNN